MKKPKEDPKDKEARLQERRIAEVERTRAAQTQSRDLTGDVRRNYGNRVSMFGLVRPIQTTPARPTTAVRTATTAASARDRFTNGGNR